MTISQRSDRGGDLRGEYMFVIYGRMRGDGLERSSFDRDEVIITRLRYLRCQGNLPDVAMYPTQSTFVHKRYYKVHTVSGVTDQR